MKRRGFLVAALVAAILVLTMGFAWARGPSWGGWMMGTADRMGNVGADDGDWAAWMDRMHDSPEMQQIRDQMPEDLQQECDEMHDAMEEGGWSGMGGMMGGHGGMMGGWTSTGT